MTGDPPRRWDDDSPKEDDEAHRAAEIDRLQRWAKEQPHRPLTDALQAHGVMPGDPGGESWAGPVITPDWWDDVAEPGAGCPWCQRPGVPSPCADCRQARVTAGDPPFVWAWWVSLAPARRRLHIAARFGTDPWTGRRVTILAEWLDVDRAGQHRYLGCTPDGIYWKAAAAH
jgi:hypothetical protein